MLGRLAATLRMAATWQLSFLYAVAFGGFVAFSVYLPTYLTTAYHLDRADAALRTAGFVVLAVVMRPIGGWLCDRLRPTAVLATAFAVVAIFAVLAAFQLPLIPAGSVDSSRRWSWAWSTALSAATPSDSCCSPRPLPPQGCSPRRSCDAAPRP
jgi:nitrate/nitrite transporter NarK